MKLATLCYIGKDDKILMLQRNKKINDIHKGYWVPPGGKLEYNESPEECAIREVHEETGLIVKNPKYKGFLTFEGSDDTPFGDLWYVWIYYFDNFEGKLIDSPEGTLEWIKKDEIKNLKMWEGDKIFTPMVFEGKLFSVKFRYEKEEMKEYDVRYI